VYTLIRLDSVSFSELLGQWRPHFNGDEDLLYEHCRPLLDHAERICNEIPPDPSYGIFALTSLRSDALSYEGFTHVNHKLPRTPSSEVRLVWNALHPKYERELTPELLAEFTVSYIVGAIKLAQGSLLAKSVRIYMASAVDRSYAQGIVASMRVQMGDESPIEFAGNWLHIGGIEPIAV
jgi:hypothetical protein